MNIRSSISLFLQLRAGAALIALAIVSATLSATGQGQIFATPEEAALALGQAANTTNRVALGKIFGPEGKKLTNPDSVQSATELAEFAAAFNLTNQIVRDSDTHAVLQVGANDWPFPIPLVKLSDGWRFDTKAGADEILDRRIGQNELETLRVVRAYVEAQREYALRDRDGDEVLEYAQKIASSAGQMDGLYWPPDLNGEISPLGPLTAEAQNQGYFKKRSESNTPQPFHGYFFKILTSQDKHAPGGKYNYVINGNMIGGFALVAWPASYGDTGIMTFIVNQQGRVYQKNLGAKTTTLAQKMKAYDPDTSWQVSAD